MEKYSKCVRVGKRLFRYNYEHGVVEYVYKFDKEMQRINEEAQCEVFENDGGYCVADSVGLRRENWENKVARREYLEDYSYDLDEEYAYMTACGI